MLGVTWNGRLFAPRGSSSRTHRNGESYSHIQVFFTERAQGFAFAPPVCLVWSVASPIPSPDRRERTARLLLHEITWPVEKKEVARALKSLEAGGSGSTDSWLWLLQTCSKLPKADQDIATTLLDELQKLSVDSFLAHHPDEVARYNSKPPIAPGSGDKQT